MIITGLKLPGQMALQHEQRYYLRSRMPGYPGSVQPGCQGTGFQGVFEDMTPYLEKSSVLSKDDFFEIL